jgi:hypothetical protein
MRTEDRVIPDLLCGHDEHLVRETEAPELRGGRAPPPRTVRPALPMQLQGLPSLADPAARVATGRSRPAHTGVSPVLSPARLCRPPAEAPRAFHVMAKPTGRNGNLDCDYCFYLSKEMLRRFAAKFLYRPGSKQALRDSPRIG